VPQSFKRSLKWMGIVLLVLGLLAGAVLARLAYGPLSAGILIPWLRAQADTALGPIDASFAEIRLAWSVETGRASIQVDNVRLAAPGGEQLAAGRVVLSCDALPLVRGRFRARDIRVEDVDIALTWRADRVLDVLATVAPGADADRAHAGGADEAGELPALRLPAPIMTMVEGLRGESGGSAAFVLLEAVQLEPLSITLTEEASGTPWRLAEAALRFTRTEGGLAVQGGGRLHGRYARAGRLALSGSKRDDAEHWEAVFSLDELDLPALAAGIPALARLSGVEMPVAADLSTRIAQDGALDQAALSLDAGAGSLVWPPVYPEPRAFSEMRARLGVNGATRRLRIEELAAEFAGTTLSVSGHADFSGEAPALSLTGGFGALTTPELARYWPRGFAAGGRRWVNENIPEGRVLDTDLHLDIGPEAWASPALLPAEAFRFDFAFSGLTAHVLRPAPPLEGASGSARLTADRLAMDLGAGRLDGLPVAGSRITMIGLETRDPPDAEVDLRVEGALSNVLRLIDHAPMGYASQFGIAPGDVRGETRIAADLDFPLLAALPLERVKIALNAEIADFALPTLIGAHGLEDGQLLLDVTNDSLTASGSAEVAGVPLDLEWDERFDPPAGTLPSRYAASGDLDRAAVTRLLGNPGERFSGQTAVEVTLRADGPQLHRGHLRADLAAAELALPELGWRKPKDEAGQAAFSVDFTREAVLPIEAITFDSGEDRFRGSLRLAPETGALRGVRIERLDLGRNALSGALELDAEGGLRGRLAGSSFDARHLLESFEPSAQAAASEAPAPPIDLQLDFETVHALAEVDFSDVEVDARRADGYWHKLAIQAALGDENRLRFDLGPHPEQSGRRMTIAANDAGRALKGLGVVEHIEGGRLDLEARLEGHAESVSMNGLLTLEDFLLREDPAVAESLEKETESKLREYVGEDGIDFSEAHLPFTLRDGVIDIDDGRANGPEVGITLEGQIDRALTRINMNGVIVPAYFFNSLLGNIPLIGDIFTGGSGGGLFALTYRVEGDASDPDISVSALSALMPGILRKPFEGSKGTIEPPDVEEGEDTGEGETAGDNSGDNDGGG